jgi:IclR family acetate operon transcriptional repressor
VDDDWEAEAMSATGHRTLRVLEYLAKEGGSSLGKIASDLELNKATAHRLVNTLVRAGYASQDPDTRIYGPSTKILELGSQVLDKIDMRRLVHPHLEALATLSGETVHLAVLDDLAIVYIDKVDGRQPVTMTSRIGSRDNCHSTSLGKVLLANRPETEWRRYVAEVGLPRRTASTITDLEEFERILMAAREKDYAVDDAENEEGIRCVASPVRDHTGEVVAAMSISGWTLSVTPKRARELTPVVIAHARQASRALGDAARASA